MLLLGVYLSTHFHPHSPQPYTFKPWWSAAANGSVVSYKTQMNSLHSKWNLLWCGLPACIDDYRSPPREIVFVIVSPLVESSDTSLISQTEEAIWQSGVKMAPVSPLNFMNLHSFVCVNIFHISLLATYQIMVFLGGHRATLTVEQFSGMCRSWSDSSEVEAARPD